MSDDVKDCPVCAETIKASAIKCRFCNTDLQAFASQQEGEVERELFHGHPDVVVSIWQWFWVVVTLGLAYVGFWLKSLGTTYTVTTQRIKIEVGVLSKVRENVELFRIDHFELHSPFGMRLTGHSLLHLRSSDASMQTIVIYGIPNLATLADTLRECSLRERTRRRVTTFVSA